MEIFEWERQIKMERKQKDMFFAGHFQSPIPVEDRNRFKGLNYYPPNPDYYFELKLHEHSQKKVLKSLSNIIS